MERLKIKKCSKTALMPVRATEGSAGYDLCADCDDCVINPDEIKKIPTGIAIGIENHECVGLVYARSGLSSRAGLAPVNCVGVIDSDYRGEIIVPLINHSSEPYTIKRGERIAQLVLAPIYIPDLEEAEELDGTQRGEGGFGSTGVK